MTSEIFRRISTLRNFCLLIALAGATLIFAQAPAPTPAKLVVKNAFILTMAPGQREPVKGYLVVGEDGRLLTVAGGDPPPGLQAAQSLEHGERGFVQGCDVRRAGTSALNRLRSAPNDISRLALSSHSTKRMQRRLCHSVSRPTSASSG